MNESGESARDEAEPGSVPIPMAVALLFGGAVSLGMCVAGLFSLVESSWPLAFGFDLNGDRNYPFPYPEGIGIGTVLVVFGVALLAALVMMARGSRTGRILSAAGFVIVLAFVVFIAFAASGSRQCARWSYTGQEFCTSRGRAILRDTVLLAIIPVVALVATWHAGRARRK